MIAWEVKEEPQGICSFCDGTPDKVLWAHCHKGHVTAICERCVKGVLIEFANHELHKVTL
jgi:hypothetical protein